MISEVYKFFTQGNTKEYRQAVMSAASCAFTQQQYMTEITKIYVDETDQGEHLVKVFVETKEKALLLMA